MSLKVEDFFFVGGSYHEGVYNKFKPELIKCKNCDNLFKDEGDVFICKVLPPDSMGSQPAVKNPGSAHCTHHFKMNMERFKKYQELFDAQLKTKAEELFRTISNMDRI